MSEKQIKKSRSSHGTVRPAMTKVLDYILQRPEKLFLFVILISGAFLIFTIPPFSGYDEANHFYRAYQVSQGHVISEKGTRGTHEVAGGTLPKSLGLAVLDLAVKNPHAHNKYASLDTAKISDELHQNLHANDKMYLEFSNTALYSPVAYLPYSLMAFAANHLSASPLLMLYLMRIAGFMVEGVLTYYAIKLLPRGKWTLVFIALLPSTLFQAATISIDSITIGASFLTIAVITSFLVARKQLSNTQLVGLIALFVFLAFLKPPYTLLVLLTPLLWRQIEGTLRRLVSFVLLFSAAIVPQLAWLHAIRNITFPYRNIAFNLQLNIDTHQQAHWILTHPFSYVLTLLRSLTHINYLPVNVSIPDFLPGIIAIMCFSTLLLLIVRSTNFSSPNEPSLSRSQTIWYTVVFAISCVILLTTLYVSWDPVGAPIIDDFRSRYLIPVLPLLVLAASRLPLKLEDKSCLIEKIGILLACLSPIILISYFVLP